MFALVFALVGAGTASATVLCKEAKNPCGADYPAGTEVKAELVAGSVAIFDSPTKIRYDECKKSTLTGKTTGTGGSSSTVTIALTALSWSECKATKEFLKFGSFEVHYSEGANGTATAKAVEWKESGCTYVAAAEPVKISTLKASTSLTSHATLAMQLEAKGSGIFCNTAVLVSADYTITAPVPLFVEPS
jgi:hypothetical protein